MDLSNLNRPRRPLYMIPRRAIPNDGRATRRPTIGIRRSSSRQDLAQQQSRQRAQPPPSQAPDECSTIDFASRPRRSSDSRQYETYDRNPNHDLVRFATGPNTVRNGAEHMPALQEESSTPQTPAEVAIKQNRVPLSDTPAPPPIPPQETQQDEKRGAPRRFDRFTSAGRARRRANSAASQEEEYDPELVNLLDVIDPEVSTLSTLTNVQNSLFVPDLGSLVNRRPTYNLTAVPQRIGRPSVVRADDQLQDEVDEEAREELERSRDSDLGTIDSRLSESHYAVLPHGVTLDGWTQEEKESLNDHVRHMLHSRRAAFHRGLKGFGQYVRRPLGLFVTVYAVLITIFGFTWVFFLIGWVNLGARRSIVIKAIDYVLVGLFAIVGDGLIPFRTIDTYHMIYIAHYHHLTWSIRSKQKMPKLPNPNDLPERVPGLDTARTSHEASSSLELGRPSYQSRPSQQTLALHDENNPGYYSVLSPEQQRKLEHHQTKFSKSHTFYKPHETETHFAFPLRLLVAIVVILDFHSIFQLALGLCTWAIPDSKRPFILTTVILICSLTCNITGGVLISIGDRRTRKKDVREKMFRQALTEDAIHQMQKERKKELGPEADVPEVKDDRAEGERVREQRKREAAGV